jgi:hypothetical protein
MEVFNNMDAAFNIDDPINWQTYDIPGEHEILEFPNFPHDESHWNTSLMMDEYALSKSAPRQDFSPPTESLNALPPMAMDIEPLQLSPPLNPPTVPQDPIYPTFPAPQLPSVSIFNRPAITLPPAPRLIPYRDAIKFGDPLTCVPPKIRSIIFTHLLADYPELRYIEVPDARDLTYPQFTQFNDFWYTEACQIMIQRATFSISTDAAVFSLIVFLNEFQPHESYEDVRTLEFTSLTPFEKGEFSANAPTLLRKCTGLRELRLLVDFQDLEWTYTRGGRELDIDAMLGKYDLEAIAQLPNLQTVVLDLAPSMALQKRLAAMEEERADLSALLHCVIPGVGSFWGLKEWLELKALEDMRVLNVVCPE